MSGSSLDGLDIAYVHLNETAGAWTYEIQQTACYPYNSEWINKLEHAVSLGAIDYQLLHAEYGNFIGENVNRFINENSLQYQVQIVASHGHTTFHVPQKKMTAQLGDGAAIAAKTNINVVSDLRSMDVALGGQGAPIIPIGEKLLLSGYNFYLNLGGIANISTHVNSPGNSENSANDFIAFDICPANRVLNLLAQKEKKAFDENGEMAARGSVNLPLLNQLNQFGYYKLPFPKSLANDFGTNEVFPLIDRANCSTADALRTYVEHICMQIKNSAATILKKFEFPSVGLKILATGGGAHNSFLVERLKLALQELNIELVIPEARLIDFKEALVIALIGALRWREENNVLASVTGASRSSVGGAVWIGN